MESIVVACITGVMILVGVILSNSKSRALRVCCWSFRALLWAASCSRMGFEMAISRANVAAQIMEHLCTCPEHGYSQPGRHGTSGYCNVKTDAGTIKVKKGDRDCSSAVCEAWELARAVINGDYGNGDERKRRLSSKYAAVQKRVNELLARRRG